jgi:hypothetical protein
MKTNIKRRLLKARQEDPKETKILSLRRKFFKFNKCCDIRPKRKI